MMHSKTVLDGIIGLRQVRDFTQVILQLFIREEVHTGSGEFCDVVSELCQVRHFDVSRHELRQLLKPEAV